MTPAQHNEARVAVAECCGLKPYLECAEHGEYSALTVSDFLVIGGCCRWCGGDLTLKDLPDYCQDLNACAEMERTLTEEQYRGYVENLVSRAMPIETPEAYARATVSATALQRCEAFLRVRGRWRPEWDGAAPTAP